MRLDGQVGPNQYADGGQPDPLRLGSYGEMVVSNFHGLWAEETLRGNAFIYSSTTAASVTALGNNIPTIFNPSGSGKICILGKLTLQVAAIGTPVTSGFQYGFLNNAGSQIGTASPILTATFVAAQNINLGGPQKGSKMLFAPAAITFTTAPALLAAVGIDLGSTSTQTPWTGIDDINGRIVIWPGGALSVGASTATSTTFNVSLWGIELPVPPISQ